MSKAEFLETLEIQLLGQIPDGKASGHVRYYRNYIEEQMSKGRSEEEVLRELGDPRLIAKTILDTDPEAGQGIYEEYVSDSYEEENFGGQSGRQQPYGEYDHDSQRSGRVKHHSYHLDLTTWYGKALAIAIAALVIIGLLFVIGTMLPVIIIAVLVISLISWLRRR